MRYLFALAMFLIFSSPVLADGGRQPFPRLTAQQLIDAWLLPPGAKNAFDRTAKGWSNLDQAQGYLDGVRDASLGNEWCDTGALKQDELDAYVIGELRKLPPSALRANAAKLVVKLLRERYPCRPSAKEKN